jgi:hypothetical protein
LGEKTISDFGLSLVDDANAAAARTTLGITGTVAALQTYTVGTLPSANTMPNQIALVSDGYDGTPCLAYSDGAAWWTLAHRIGKPVSATPTHTIAAGVIAVTGGPDVAVDTEASAATDDLDTINGTVNGQIVVIRAVNSARTVVLRDGVGNLRLTGNITLDNNEDRVILRSNGTNLFQLAPLSDNGA